MLRVVLVERDLVYDQGLAALHDHLGRDCAITVFQEVPTHPAAVGQAIRQRAVVRQQGSVVGDRGPATSLPTRSFQGAEAIECIRGGPIEDLHA